MLIIPPPKYRRRRGRPLESAQAPSPPPPPPPPPPVTIVSVIAQDSTHLLFTFSDDVVDALPDTIPELRGSDNVGSGWRSPFEVELTGDNQISAHYDGTDFLADGFNWEVLTVPVGVNFVGGGMLVVPEAG